MCRCEILQGHKCVSPRNFARMRHTLLRNLARTKFRKAMHVSLLILSTCVLAICHKDTSASLRSFAKTRYGNKQNASSKHQELFVVQFFYSWMHMFGLSLFMWENMYGPVDSKLCVMLQEPAFHAHSYNFAITILRYARRTIHYFEEVCSALSNHRTQDKKGRMYCLYKSVTVYL